MSKLKISDAVREVHAEYVARHLKNRAEQKEWLDTVPAQVAQELAELLARQAAEPATTPQQRSNQTRARNRLLKTQAYLEQERADFASGRWDAVWGPSPVESMERAARAKAKEAKAKAKEAKARARANHARQRERLREFHRRDPVLFRQYNGSLLARLRRVGKPLPVLARAGGVGQGTERDRQAPIAP